MEASEPLSIESFSYSWLVNLKPSFESPKGSFRASFDASDESNFIVMDPKLSPSKRFLVFHQDFDFDLPTLQPPVHADELISNGYLIPLFLKQLDIGSYDSSSNSTPTSPLSSPTPENTCLCGRSLSLSFRRYNRRVVQKYLNLVKLLWFRIRRGRCGTSEVQGAKNWERSGTGTLSPNRSESYSADNWGRSCDAQTSKNLGCSGMSSPRASEAHAADSWPTSWVFERAKNWEPSGTSSPRSSEAYAVDSWRRSCDSESSIYEAVLHCKKTIE